METDVLEVVEMTPQQMKDFVEKTQKEARADLEVKIADLETKIRQGRDMGILQGAPNDRVLNKGIIRFGRDGQEEQKQCKHIFDFLYSVWTKDRGGLDDLRKENPQYYEAKANFNETTAGQGTELVPVIWSNEIINTADKYGYARKIARNYPMIKKEEKLNRRGTFTAAMVAEATAPTIIDATSFYTQTTITAKASKIQFALSLEVFEDANPAMLADITDEAGRALAQLEDEQFFKGAGSGANHTGLVLTSGVTVKYLGDASNSGKTTRANVSWTDLVNASLGINPTLQDGAVFIIPQTLWGYLIKETAGSRPVWDYVKPIDIKGMNGIDAKAYWTPLGFDTIVVPDGLFPTDAVTTACGIFGNFNRFGYFGERRGLTIKEFREQMNGVDLAGTDQVGYSLTERFGVAFPAPAAFVVLKTSTT